MRRALALARQGEGHVHPNPMVGAVLAKGGRVLSEGAHERFGSAHAEVNALKKFKKVPVGSTLYVTLEPCAHFGKTPPCADFLLEKGLRRVVVAMKDPNSKVAGRGIQKLKKQGVSVRVGLLEKEARTMNRFYIHWIKTRRPYVTVKVGQSLDGKIATRTGRSKWITGEDSRRRAHVLRRSADAILVGVNTVFKDNPLLSVRLPGQCSQPLKVVLDATLKTKPSSAIFSSKSPGKVLIFTTRRAQALRGRALSGKAELFSVPEKKKGLLNWRAVLKELGRRGIVHLLVEGGGEILGSLFSENRVQEAYFFMAPRIVGGRGAVGSVGGEGVSEISHAARFKRWSSERVGEDLLFHGVL